MILLVVSVTCSASQSLAILRHGLIWYARANNTETCRIAAARYEVGITGKGEYSDPDKVYIKSLNPAFRWFVYNSGTDNYVQPPRDTSEHDALVALADEKGWDPEVGYLHYYDDTQLVLQGDTILVRGWGGGTAVTAAEARVPVYYSALTRKALNFSSPRAMQLHKEVTVALGFDTPFTGSDLYPDGLFIDNSTPYLFHYGIILSGGRVLEPPGNTLIGSPAFQSWHWTNYSGFLEALKDTLTVSPSWAADRRRKFLMINVADTWDDSFASGDIADILFLEFQYNPVRNYGRDFVAEAYRRDSQAAAAGVQCFYTAIMKQDVDGGPDSFTYAETLLGNLAWFLVTRTSRTLFFETGTSNPGSAAWDSLNWRGCIDVANEYLGEFLGPPYTLATGTDPLGNAFTVAARDYDRGLAVVRNRGDWDEGIEPETAVTVQLPRPLATVSSSGSLGTVVEEISIRNGQGFLFVTPPNSTSVSQSFDGAGDFLAHNFPNPVRDETVIRFGLTTPGRALVRVLDVRGREIARLFDRTAGTGTHTVTWNGRNLSGKRLSGGIYVYRLDTPTTSRSRRLLLLP